MNSPYSHKHHQYRAIIDDTLPYETPPFFSNRGIYQFLKKVKLEIIGKKVYWRSTTSSYDNAVKYIFGVDFSSPVEVTREQINNTTITYRSIKLPKDKKYDSVPYKFNIAHKPGRYRQLTVAHPRNQILLAAFIKDHAATIINLCSKSKFSIRYPAKVAKTVISSNEFNLKSLSLQFKSVEQHDEEYQNIGSYFSYSSFNNIHKFFESQLYRNAEFKHAKLLQLDISRFFESIYTHTIEWAQLGFVLPKFGNGQSFARKFDKTIRDPNQKETNGIMIGPEVSRIFSEIIMQSVDNSIEKSLMKIGLKRDFDYNLYRYIDDIFVFCSHQSTEQSVLEIIESTLFDYKLRINPNKIVEYSKPIITNLTIAKDEISDLFSQHCTVSKNEDIEIQAHGVFGWNAVKHLRIELTFNEKRLITAYKALIVRNSVSVDEVSNYTLGTVLKRCLAALKLVEIQGTEAEEEDNSPIIENLIKFILSLHRFAFYVYLLDPKATFLIKIARMMSLSVKFLDLHGTKSQKRHLKSYLNRMIVDTLDNHHQSPTSYTTETTYLLSLLSILGKRHYLPEEDVIRYLNLDNSKDSSYYNGADGYFAIISGLLYVKNKKKYDRVRKSLEKRATDILERDRHVLQPSAEACILVLDLVTCPYISNNTKGKLRSYLGISYYHFTKLQSSSDFWFVDWKSFDLAKELDAKRKREVY